MKFNYNRYSIFFLFFILAVPIVTFSEFLIKISGDGSHFLMDMEEFSIISREGKYHVNAEENIELSSYFPFFFIFDLFIFFLNKDFSTYLTYISLRYIIPFVSIYIFLRSFFNYSNLIFFPTIFFYIYNPLLSQIGFEYNFYSIYSIAPMTIGFYHILVQNFFENKKKYNFLLIILISLSLFLSQSGIMLVTYVPVMFIFGIGFFIYYLNKVYKNKLNISNYFFIHLLLLAFIYYLIFIGLRRNILFSQELDEEFFRDFIF